MNKKDEDIKKAKTEAEKIKAEIKEATKEIWKMPSGRELYEKDLKRLEEMFKEPEDFNILVRVLGYPNREKNFLYTVENPFLPNVGGTLEDIGRTFTINREVEEFVKNKIITLFTTLKARKVAIVEKKIIKEKEKEKERKKTAEKEIKKAKNKASSLIKKTGAVKGR